MCFDETVVRFGKDNSLTGILCVPEQSSHQYPAVILVNAGTLHRVGPCRSSVLLARTLAEKGYPSLRFDYPGIGDSGFGENNGSYTEHHNHELATAIDFVESRCGSHKFVVHGLCSGARDAFHIALEDARVVGISQVDSHAYRNGRYYVHKIKSKLFNLTAWLNFIKTRMFDRVKDKTGGSDDMTAAWPGYPPKRVIEEGYKKLCERNVRFFVTYTGSWAETYNYENQFYDMYPKADLKSSTLLNYMPDANHIMTNPDDRRVFASSFFQFIDEL